MRHLRYILAFILATVFLNSNAQKLIYEINRHEPCKPYTAPYRNHCTPDSIHSIRIYDLGNYKYYMIHRTCNHTDTFIIRRCQATIEIHNVNVYNSTKQFDIQVYPDAHFEKIRFDDSIRESHNLTIAEFNHLPDSVRYTKEEMKFVNKARLTTNRFSNNASLYLHIVTLREFFKRLDNPNYQIKQNNLIFDFEVYNEKEYPYTKHFLLNHGYFFFPTNEGFFECDLSLPLRTYWEINSKKENQTDESLGIYYRKGRRTLSVGCSGFCFSTDMYQSTFAKCMRAIWNYKPTDLDNYPEDTHLYGFEGE